MAIRTMQPVTVPDIELVSDLFHWKTESLDRGYRSMLALPLFHNDQVYGNLAIYADRPHAYDTDEVDLLREMAEDLAFGIHALRERSDRQRAELALQEQEAQLRQIIQQMPFPVLTLLPDGTALTVNKSFLEQFGLQSGAKIVGKFNIHAETRLVEMLNLHDTVRRIFKGEIVYIPELIIPFDEFSPKWGGKKQGTTIQEVTAFPVFSPTGEISLVVAIFKDITERKHAAELLALSNVELALAYDATLEGWSNALELRERETAGHSQRVVGMTLRLAESLEVPVEDLIHIRRGALLHDLGKMGIPDNILLKPGPLSADEWVIMRQHPLFAYRLLVGIPYLKPALDIPYSHHERWDGGGYPRGLKGEDIPLAARIFSVVDVYDALTSNRPYRPAWTDADALVYLKEHAGTHFDSAVVEIFLKIILKPGG
jgi:HD-GYP domain-containing protein (c-di-GMP phosphodiesterase class II)